MKVNPGHSERRIVGRKKGMWRVLPLQNMFFGKPGPRNKDSNVILIINIGESYSSKMKT